MSDKLTERVFYTGIVLVILAFVLALFVPYLLECVPYGRLMNIVLLGIGSFMGLTPIFRQV